MKKFYFLIIIFSIIIILFIGLRFLLNETGKNKKIQLPISNQIEGRIFNLEPQSSNENSVIVTVTPQNFSEKTWDFVISLNTHSVELNIDLTKYAILLDEKGNEYLPVEWDGDPLGGHHRNGILKFNPISPQPKAITLKIINVGGIGERIFNWQFK